MGFFIGLFFMKILCAFDKFKDSISAKKVGEAVIEGIKMKKSNFYFENIPLSGFF